MNVAKPIYVIGHRNPDTDSICSAIGYAHLKQAMGVNAVAARAGKVNKETRFALEYFHVEKPLLIPDLYPRVKDIAMDCKIVVRQHDTLRNLGEVLRENDLRSIPVTDSQGLLVGIVSVSDLAKRYFQELGMTNLSDMRVRYRDIIRATDSNVLVSVMSRRQARDRFASLPEVSQRLRRSSKGTTSCSWATESPRRF